MKITSFDIFLSKHACDDCKGGNTKVAGQSPGKKIGQDRLWSKKVRPLCAKCYKSYSNYCKKTYQDAFKGLKDEN